MPSSWKNSTSDPLQPRRSADAATGLENAAIIKTALKLALVLALGYGLVVGLMFYAQRGLLYAGASFSAAAPRSAPWGQTVRIRTSDGEMLYALRSRAAPGRPTILFFHGNADRVTHYGFLADGLAAHGIGLLAVSYRGFTGSSGSPTEAGLLNDGLAAYDWLAGATTAPIVALGQSLGSAVAVHLARERPELDGVILISAFDSIVELASSIYFFLPVRLLLRDTFRADLWIGEVHQPKLFVHGERDAVVPIRHGRSLFERAPEPKRLRIFDDHGHNDIWTDGLVDEVADFAASIEASR